MGSASISVGRLPGKFRGSLSLAALFVLLTVALTWPQVVQPAGVLPHGDSWFNLWRISWIAHQLPRDPLHLFDANIHYPSRGTLAYSDAVLLQGLLGAPLQWLGVPTAIVGTVLVLGSFVFAGLSACALVRYLTGSTPAGVIAGIVFAFASFRFDHYMHLELLWGGWMPLVLLAAHRALEQGRVWAGVGAGLLFVAQALSCIYHAVFFATLLALFVPIVSVGLPWKTVRRGGASLIAGFAVAVVILLPYLEPYRHVRETLGGRRIDEAGFHGAGPRHYLSTTPENLVYGARTGDLGRHEKRLFPGLVATTLVAVALWPPLDRRRVAYLVALLLAVDLSSGTNGLTYSTLREHLFIYEGLRVPARAGQLALLVIAVLAGIGFARLEQRWQGRVVLRRAMGPVVALAALVEYVNVPLRLVAVPTRPPAAYQWLARQPAGVVAEFPMPILAEGLPRHDSEFAFLSSFHWKPLLNGYSGTAPHAYLDLLRKVETFPAPDAIDALRKAGATYITVHERLYGTDRYREVIHALTMNPGLARRGAFGDAASEISVFELIDVKPRD